MMADTVTNTQIGDRPYTRCACITIPSYVQNEGACMKMGTDAVEEIRAIAGMTAW